MINQIKISARRIIVTIGSLYVLAAVYFSPDLFFKKPLPIDVRFLVVLVGTAYYWAMHSSYSTII